MKPLGLKEWFLFSIPAFLMGIGVGFGVSARSEWFYIFIAGVILEIPTLWLIYKHK